MALKYAGDAALVWGAVPRLWSPLEYLVPSFDLRRAVDAGRSP